MNPNLVDYKLALALGACHLPLQGLHHVLLQLLTFNTSWRSSEWRAEIRQSVLRGETGRATLQIIRCSQEPILWAQFLYLPISRKALKSFMVTLLLVTRKDFMRLIETFWKICAWLHVLPLHQKSHLYWPPTPPPPTKCPTLSDPMDCSPPGSYVHGIFQARVLEWGAMLVSTKHQHESAIGILMSLPSLKEVLKSAYSPASVGYRRPTVDCESAPGPSLHPESRWRGQVSHPLWASEPFFT